MRYVCYKTSISKIVDEKIEDISVIKDLLSVFHNLELSCSLKYKNGRDFKKVRITQIYENSFDFKAVESKSIFKNTVNFCDLEYLELTTDNKTISLVKPNVSRWNLIEPEKNFADEIGE